MADPLVNPAETLKVLRGSGIHLTKRLGQHFLVDGNILRRIIREAEEATGGLSGRHILEVGPGIGTLTEALLAAGAIVTAVEIDERFQRMLAERFDARPADTPGELRVVPSDAMRLDAAELERPGHGMPSALVANLPYAVATPLILDYLRTIPSISAMVVMVQDEAAARLTASPGGKIYGGVTARLSTVAKARKLFPVSARSFMPPPSVSSAVVLVERRPDAPAPEQLQSLWSLIDAAFAGRRKTIRNTLMAAGERAAGASTPNGPSNERWMAGLPALEDAFARAGVQGTQRAEELDADAFTGLHSALVEAALKIDEGQGTE